MITQHHVIEPRRGAVAAPGGHQATKSERLTAFAEGPITDGRALLERLALASLQSFVEPREQKLFRILMSDGVRLAKLGRINLYERMTSGHGRQSSFYKTTTSLPAARPASISACASTIWPSL